MHALPFQQYMQITPHFCLGENAATYLLCEGMEERALSLQAGIDLLINLVLQHFFVCRCDRVLWYGDRIRQVAYRHGDSRLSDHRSVSAIFLTEVDVVNSTKLRRACVLPKDVEMVTKAVVPRVAPIIDVEKLQNNEVWSTIL